ncbi:ATP-binding protein [Desulfovibrio ferrophilus]|uniref:Predicted anti-sigma F protein n=1 Tax=Desulfovibrio ferrophilus TaxID=241368 RepID=A0A2Z6AYB9_9BACT|nr:ATP-binding protein [Desulfovibrio ferrophilus]BBD08257.1 predicted anti-sigma F protein [Desulfovibrio ferrophilus]
MDSLRLPATLSSLPGFRDHVCSAVLGLAPDVDTGMLEMALEELLVNVVNYAYPEGSGDIEVETEARGGALRIAIIDAGLAYDPTETTPPDLEAGIEDRPIGGLGVFLAKKVFASMIYRRDEDKNILELSYAPPPSAPG